eukprot:tig00021046_g17785.t1
MRLLCSDGETVVCPGALVADSELLADVSECSDAHTNAIPMPITSTVILAAGIALNDRSASRPFASLQVPHGGPDSRAAPAMALIARLGVAAEFLRAPKLAHACAKLFEGAITHEKALGELWEDHVRFATGAAPRRVRKRKIEETVPCKNQSD